MIKIKKLKMLLLLLVVTFSLVLIIPGNKVKAYTPVKYDGLSIESSSKSLVNGLYEHEIVYLLPSNYNYVYVELSGYLQGDYEIVSYKLNFHVSTHTSDEEDAVNNNSNFEITQRVFESNTFDWNYDILTVTLYQSNNTNYTISYNDYLYINCSDEVSVGFLGSSTQTEIYYQGVSDGTSAALELYDFVIDNNNDSYDDASYTAGRSSVDSIQDFNDDGYDDVSYSSGVASVDAVVDSNNDGYDDDSYLQGGIDADAGIDSIIQFVPGILGAGFGFLFQIASIKFLGISGLEILGGLAAIAAVLITFKIFVQK